MKIYGSVQHHRDGEDTLNMTEPEPEGEICDGTKIFSKTKIEGKVHIAPNVTIVGKGKLVLKDGVAIAPGVVIYTSRPTFRGKRWDKHSKMKNHKAKIGKVVLHEGVYIGANSTVGHNLEICNGNVIAANSTVKDTLHGSNSLYAGQPVEWKKTL